MPVTEMKFTDADLRILADALTDRILRLNKAVWTEKTIQRRADAIELRETITDRLEGMKSDE